MVNLDCTEYRPELAFVFYKERSYLNARAYVMQHDVLRNKNSFSLGAGKAVSVRQMDAVFAAMRHDQQQKMELIPDGLLAYNSANKHMVWYQPQVVDEMFLLCEGATKRVVTCWPAMLFAVTGKTMYCFALPRNERPNGETALMYAPFGNIYSKGSLCTGNAILPKMGGLDSVEQWNGVFYRTAFSHPNGNHQMLTGVNRHNISRWWANRDGVKRFPYAKLINAGITLNGLIRAVDESNE